MSEKQEKQHTLLFMAEQLDKYKAGSMHMQANNMKREKGLIGVLSVYRNEKPSHTVLDELEEWADQTARKDVLQKIQDLKLDMSWNKNNPV